MDRRYNTYDETKAKARALEDGRCSLARARAAADQSDVVFLCRATLRDTTYRSFRPLGWRCVAGVIAGYHLPSGTSR